MKIPLVAQSTLGASTSPFLKSTSTIYSPFAQLDPLSASQRLRTVGGGDDAIKSRLSEESEDVSKLSEDDDRGIRIRGFLGSALKELSRLSNQMEELQGKISQSEGNIEAQDLFRTQLGTIAQEVERIVQSEPFSQALETARALESAVQSGKISRRSLQSVSSLLGDDFANLVSSGAISDLKKITGGLSRLSEAGAEGLLSDEGAAGKLGSLVSELTATLRSAKAPKQVAQAEKATESVTLVEAPTLTETSFAAAGDVALSLRTYQGKDLLRAVASGFVDNADDLFQLIIEPPKPDDENQEEEDLKAEREEQKSSSRNGLRVEEGTESPTTVTEEQVE